MVRRRSAFQGIKNILMFNWHTYALAFLLIVGLGLGYKHLPEPWSQVSLWMFLGAIVPLLLSLVMSYIVYDCSNLYSMNWLNEQNANRILNIHAGFDESSASIKAKFPNATVYNGDFYDPNKHTEVSIKRARRHYPPSKDTIQLRTEELDWPNEEFDLIVGFFSLHEIRNQKERIQFFQEIHRVLKSGGSVYVTEHVRNWRNWLSYSLGALHFHSKNDWLETFEKSGFTLRQEIQTSFLITTFRLQKNGNTP